jgi:hypothetical protein
MKTQFEIGLEDAREGKEPYLPTKDFLDHIGVGHTDEQVDERIEYYEKGYTVGTQQRLSDSTSK